MSEMNFDHVLDAKGLNCPMPIVRARQQLRNMEAGQVLKVVATDKGSVGDFQGWARATGDIELLDQQTTTDDGQDVYVHYLKKA